MGGATHEAATKKAPCLLYGGFLPPIDPLRKPYRTVAKRSHRRSPRGLREGGDRRRLPAVCSVVGGEEMGRPARGRMCIQHYTNTIGNVEERGPPQRGPREGSRAKDF
jgi:hypothetical protein